MKGRKPKPRTLKLLAGNPGKRRVGKDPTVKLGVPECPEHLDDEGRAEWFRVSGDLAAAGLFAHVDRGALAAYCQAWSRWVAAETMIRKTGVIIKSPNGHLIQSPMLPIANKAMEQMKAYMTEFGMTPSSRARLGNTGDGTTSSDEERFFGAG